MTRLNELIGLSVGVSDQVAQGAAHVRSVSLLRAAR
jgi:hypothetical protein